MSAVDYLDSFRLVVGGTMSQCFGPSCLKLICRYLFDPGIGSNCRFHIREWHDRQQEAALRVMPVKGAEPSATVDLHLTCGPLPIVLDPRCSSAERLHLGIALKVPHHCTTISSA